MDAHGGDCSMAVGDSYCQHVTPRSLRRDPSCVTFSKTLSLQGPDLEAVIEQWNLVRAPPYLLAAEATAAAEARGGIRLEDLEPIGW
jgi:hypothetical protein